MRRACLALFLAATPAAAQDLPLPDLPFQSANGGVYCVIVTGERNYVRCDLYGGTLSFRERPVDCEGGWGYAFEVAEQGEGRVLCTGDSVIDDAVQVMDPGFSHSRGGVACFSEPGGMTCVNGAFHGFTLTPDNQVLF